MSKIFFFSLLTFLCGLLISCNTLRSKEEIRLQLYFAQGERIYLARCSNCHQKSGEGLKLLYPPVNQSDFVDKNLDAVICLIKNGRRGELLVNGHVFNQPMPGVPTLTSLEVAELTTYLYNGWGRKHPVVEVGEVEKVLEGCK